MDLLIRLSQQTLQTQQHRRDIVNRTPLILQDIQTDPAREVDVRVVDGCFEEYRGRAVRVRVCEFHAEFEHEGRVGRVGGAVDGGRPERHVFVVGEGGYAGCGLGHDVHEFFLEPTEGISMGVWRVGRIFGRGEGIPLRDGGITTVCASIS